MSEAFAVYLLAGGQSKRMGEDKGLLLLNEKPVISHTIDALRKLTDQIHIISTDRRYHQFGLPVLPDHYGGIGPAAGIDAALQHTVLSQVFICSCDMPFISSDAVQALADKAQYHEVSVCKNGKFVEPLFAVYKKQCKIKWRELLISGTTKLTDYFNHFDTNFVDSTEMLRKNPHLFFNVNSPTDLLLAKQWLKK